MPAFDVVVMAASTGGLAAVRALLDALPGDFPLPLVLVQHRAPQYAGLLPEILRRYTALRVRLVSDGDPFQPRTLYLNRPDRQLLMTPSHRQRQVAPLVGAWPLPRGTADPLFASIAVVCGPRAIGVVLSGRSADGARGSQALKQAGGRVLVQAPETAAVADMPRAALATGCTDFVLPPRALAHALVSLALVPGAAALLTVPLNAWDRKAS